MRSDQHYGSRADAQRRADGIRSFELELRALETEGVLALTEAQRAAVSAHHRNLLARFANAFDIDRDFEAKQMSLGMRVASLLGALALAASVLFLFYQFWGRFSTLMQVSILILPAAGSFVATWWKSEPDPATK